MPLLGLNHLEQRVGVSLACVMAFRMLGLFMLMPVLAIYGQSLIGYSPLWIGLAIGAYGITQAIMQIPMGLLSDRFGRRRIIIIGLILFTLGSLLAASAESIYLVTVGRALQGMGAIASACLALAADITREEQRPKILAMIGMSIGSAFALALVLGPIIAEHFSLSGLFWFTAMAAVLSIIIVLTVVPEPHKAQSNRENLPVLPLLSRLITHTELMQLNVGIFVLHSLMTALFIVIPTQLIDLDVAAADHWMIYLPVLFGSFILMAPLIVMAIKQQEKPIYLIAIALLGVGSLGLLMGETHLAYTVVGLVLFFVGFNYLEANLPALISRVAPAGARGSAMGLYSSSQFLGAFVGGVLGGSILSFGAEKNVFIMMAIFSLLWCLISLKFRFPKRSTLVNLSSPVADAKAAQQLATKFSALEGVIEATVIVEESRTYLKVEKKHFNLEHAKQLLH